MLLLLRAIENPNHVMKTRALKKLNKKKINANFGVFFNEVYIYINLNEECMFACM